MDLSKFKTSDWLKVGGGALMLIAGFLDWVTIDYAGMDLGGGGNAFDFFWTGTVPWILVVATAVMTFLLIAGMMKPGSLPWTMIFLAATAVATLLMLIRVIFNPLEGKDLMESSGADIGRGIGMIGCAIGSILALVGSVQGFTAAGGNLADLKDPNKIKASFSTGQGGQSAPPPPPPGATPPPPPPPPVG